MSFKGNEYLRVENLMRTDKDIFYGDNGNGNFRGKYYPFILADRMNNLYAPCRDEMIDYFKKNDIAWWSGYRPTNHTLSSQIACLNHLFPIRHIKEAVLAIVQNVIPDIIDVLSIESDNYSPAFIQFEAVSKVDHLNENYSTRGSNCTSIDALICAKHKDGQRILLPIEWKYVEVYSNGSKANDKRKERYTDLINASKQLTSTIHDKYYIEPFYQLMRQTLWAEQIILHSETETIKVDDYVHLHIIPKANVNLLNKHYSCSGMGMEQTWREFLSDQSKYKIIDPSEFLAPLCNLEYSELTDYLRRRYWNDSYST